MQATRQRDTPCELAVRSAVHRLGLRFGVDRRLPGMRRRADMVFTRARLAVFVDGCYWHGCPAHGTWPKVNAAWWRAKIVANRQRDAATTRRLRKAGWLVERVWEHEAPAAAAVRIERIVRTRLRHRRPARS